MVRHKPRHGMGGNARNIRLAEQIRKDLATLIQRELDVAHVGLVTLTAVELSADYAHAKVYFTVMGVAPETASAVLNDKAGWLHALLFKMLHIHTVPTLRFVFDAHIERALALSRLIEQANQTPPQSADDPQRADLKPDDPDDAQSDRV